MIYRLLIDNYTSNRCTVSTSLCCVGFSGDLNSTYEVKGAPVDMLVFLLNTEDKVMAFSEQRDAKGVSNWQFTTTTAAAAAAAFGLVQPACSSVDTPD